MSKVWLSKAAELQWGMTRAVVQGPQWTIRADIEAATAQVWQRARGLMGLPSFRRAAVRRRGRKLFALAIVDFIQSRRYDEAGKHRRRKPLHSHWRRLLDMSGIPWAAGWRTATRAIRSAVETTRCSHDFVDIASAREHARARLDALKLEGDPAACKRCGGNMNPGIRVACVDLDQCFEACKSGRAVAARDEIAALYWRKVHEIRVLVRRGKACEVRLDALAAAAMPMLILMGTPYAGHGDWMGR